MPLCEIAKSISVVVLARKIGNNQLLETFSTGLKSDHEQGRVPPSRIHGIRRRYRRRRTFRPVGGDPAEAAQRRFEHRGGREGLRGWRAYPVRRGDRSGVARQT